MIEIELTQGFTALVDDEDAHLVLPFRWFALRSGNGTRYAARSVTRADGSQAVLLMHRVILDAPAGLEVDHINGDTLDNRRRTNLRLCTHQQNCWNKKLYRNNHGPGYRGVSWSASSGKWKVQIGHAGRQIFGGYFDDPVEAAKTYDRIIRELRGEWAVTNFPPEDEVQVIAGVA